ncbi:MAG: hypothetical protein M0D55_00355 [Elusimicrobiota bacterium]|nr:MAG: hypothetical protein M0D55_00355 [Elusimicrobiota bacterium]
MKTQRISTILMSAYLSAMLASSMAPVYNGITLAGTVNPSAAQAAFSNAVNGLDATWIVATAGVSPLPRRRSPNSHRCPQIRAGHERGNARQTAETGR